jgi:hypothetical protein
MLLTIRQNREAKVGKPCVRTAPTFFCCPKSDLEGGESAGPRESNIEKRPRVKAEPRHRRQLSLEKKTAFCALVV